MTRKYQRITHLAKRAVLCSQFWFDPNFISTERRKLSLRVLWLLLTMFSNSAYADDHTSWSTEIIDWGKVPWHSAPVDLSFLNLPERPAGKHGFLKVVKDSLIFEDDTRARFWGTNLTANALFGMNS